jgi:GAF domain-containing protein/anti-sigma regulatory factor (Ser/Thr protein kinase)
VTSHEPEPGEASATRLRHLEAISEAALAHLDFEDLVEELLTRVTEILGADTAAVLLRDRETEELVARAARGLEEEVEAEVRIPIGRGFAGRIAAERLAIIIDDVDHADILNPILREKGLRALLGVPLVVQGEVIGVMHVGRLQMPGFGPEHAELLQAAGDRIALAIDHARVYGEVVEAHQRAEAAAEELRRLESITEAALAHMSLGDLLGALLARLRDVLGTDTIAVMLVDEETQELVSRAALGLDEWLEANARIPLGEGFSGRIATDALPGVLEDVQGTPGATAFASSGIGSLIGAPLVVEGRTTGVLTAGTWERREFDPRDVALLERAADRIALAIEHARLYDAEREARAEAEAAAERIRRIESITEVALHHIALDEDVVERLLSRVLLVLDADTAALSISETAKQSVVARAPDGTTERIERDVELPPGGGFAGLVAERGEPVSVSDVESIDIVSPLLRESQITSLLGVPLILEGEVLGTLHIGTVGRRAFGDADLSLLELAGERLAVALDRSRMYEREHFVAETLQRSLLPERLPEIPGALVASRYLPGEGEAIGGDWYDVIPLRDGRFVLAMGDVVSRGVHAASVMGQLRNALRAYALDGHAPPSVLGRLHAITRTMEGRELATLVYVLFEPSSGTLTYGGAGHPPPVVIRADGETVLLEDGRGPPLGAVADALYSEATARLGPGDTLLLYTDGIVERRDMWIDEGLVLLTAQARAAAGWEPDRILDRLTTALLEDGIAHDDVALLALRTEPAPGGVLRLTLEADPTVLSGMRQSLRDWLAAVGADEDATYDVLVAATEASANAVEHAYGPVDATFELEARSLRGGEIVLVVRDSGSWRPPRGHNRGRGTLLMQQLMDDFEVTTGDAGTEVRMSKRLAREMVA